MNKADQWPCDHENPAFDQSHFRYSLDTVSTAQTYKSHLLPPGNWRVSKISTPPQTTILLAWFKLLSFLKCSAAMWLWPDLPEGPEKPAALLLPAEWAGKGPKTAKQTAHSKAEQLSLRQNKCTTLGKVVLTSELHPTFHPQIVCYSRSTYFKYRCIMNQLELYNDQAGRTFKSIM